MAFQLLFVFEVRPPWKCWTSIDPSVAPLLVQLYFRWTTIFFLSHFTSEHKTWQHLSFWCQWRHTDNTWCQLCYAAMISTQRSLSLCQPTRSPFSFPRNWTSRISQSLCHKETSCLKQSHSQSAIIWQMKSDILVMLIIKCIWYQFSTNNLKVLLSEMILYF